MKRIFLTSVEGIFFELNPFVFKCLKHCTTGNPVKKLLRIGAASVIHCNRITQEYYEQKTAESKHPICVINAVENKLISKAVAIVKSQKPFVNNFATMNEAAKNVT